MYETATLRPPRQQKLELEAESNLFRCMSDASLVKRRRGGRGKSQAQREKERQHRFSINGHFYNYKAGPTLSSGSFHPQLYPPLGVWPTAPCIPIAVALLLYLLYSCFTPVKLLKYSFSIFVKLFLVLCITPALLL